MSLIVTCTSFRRSLACWIFLSTNESLFCCSFKLTMNYKLLSGQLTCLVMTFLPLVPFWLPLQLQEGSSDLELFPTSSLLSVSCLPNAPFVVLSSDTLASFLLDEIQSF